MDHDLTPNKAQLAKLMSLPPETPLGVLNLFRFREDAAYQPGDPEHGTPEADVSGAEAFNRYSASAGQKLESLGGRVVFSTPVEQMMIGPDTAAWDLAAIMFFPSRQAFMAMLSDPAFQDTSRHRKAALAEHCMIHLNGAPFVA